jgi:hypothetical protein
MAGTITVVEETFGIPQKVTFDWLSHTDGTATITATTNYYTGELLKVLIVPDPVTTVPSDNYSVTLSDSDSYDLLCGQGTACCPTAANLVLTGGLLPITNSKLSLTIAGAGSEKGGKVQVYIR